MKAKKLALLVQYAMAQQKPDVCPPHQFEGGWSSHEGEGVIYCVRCGDIRELKAPMVGAPPEEGERVGYAG